MALSCVILRATVRLIYFPNALRTPLPPASPRRGVMAVAQDSREFYAYLDWSGVA